MSATPQVSDKATAPVNSGPGDVPPKSIAIAPGKTPSAPLLLQPGKAHSDVTGAFFKQRGRAIVATARIDHRPRKAVMRGDKMEHKIAPLARQPVEFSIFFYIPQGAEFVPVSVEKGLIYRSASLGERPRKAAALSVATRLEGALPAIRLLALVVQRSSDGNRVCYRVRKAEFIGNAQHFASRPVLMHSELLRLRNRAGIFFPRVAPVMLDREPFEGIAFVIAPQDKLILEPPFGFWCSTGRLAIGV